MKKVFYSFLMLSAIFWQASAVTLTPVTKSGNWEQGGLKTWIYDLPWVGPDCSVWIPSAGRNSIIFPTDTTLQDGFLRTNEYPVIDVLNSKWSDLIESNQIERAFVGIWKGYIEIKTAGRYRFSVWVNDIAEVKIGGGSNPIIFTAGVFFSGGGSFDTEYFDLVAGFYPILIHMADLEGYSGCNLKYNLEGAPAIGMTNDMLWHEPLDVQKATWGLNFTKWLWSDDLKLKASITPSPPANVWGGCYPDSIKFDALGNLIGGTIDYKTVDGLIRGKEYADLIIAQTGSFNNWWALGYGDKTYYSFRNSCLKNSGNSWTGVWTGSLNIENAGTYQFQMQGDDNYRMYLDGRLVIDGWFAVPGNGTSVDPARTANGEHISGWDAIHESEPINLTAGLHSIRLVLNQSAGGAYMRLAYKNTATDFEYKHVTKDMFRTTNLPTKVESIISSDVDYKLFASNGKIALHGLNGVSKISVYSFNGSLVLNKIVYSNSAEFILVAGNYIVIVNGKAKKIIVK